VPRASENALVTDVNGVGVDRIAEEMVARNRALQTEWYGEPLGERFRRLLERFAVPQAAMADLLGLSAPMLSQLMSGHRAKISNPAVMNRMLALEELAADPELARMPAQEVRDRLATIRAETAATTSSRLRVTATTTPDPPPAAPPRDAVPQLQGLLRALASAAEIEGAAALLDAEFPELAELLRVYGNGRTADARAHFARTMDAG
jgi:transcriptional regulator with XRE-family HTH domain